MKLRSILVLSSLFLSLAISADHTSNYCTGCWSGSPDAPALDEGFGVNIHFIDPEPGEVQMIADAGFHWVRTDFKWDLTERERGRYDFAPYDRLMQSLAPFGIRALFILDYGNPLYDGGGPPRTEVTRQAFAKWAAVAAQHFAHRGVIWEVYNEPNIPMFWSPRPNVDEYVALALAVGRAFRAGAPNEKLIGPAMSKIDLSFLESCFSAGLLNDWSGISVHPYRRTNPESVATEYTRLREMIERFRTGSGSDRLIPVISGEWGYSSAWRGMNEEKQATMLARQFLTNVANGIPVSIWYDWRDDGSDPAEAEHHFGLVRTDYRSGRAPVFDAKPAYLAAKTLIEQFKGCSFQQRLPVGSDEDYVLVFAKGEDRRIAAWTISPKPHHITIPVTADRFSVTTLTGQSASVTAVNRTLTIDVSSAPIYLAKAN